VGAKIGRIKEEPNKNGDAPRKSIIQ